MLTLEHLQAHLPWRMKYSREFLASTPWAHFGHGVQHVLKALGHLAGLVDVLDHEGGARVATDPEVVNDYRKYVADLVILAVRLANVFPGGPIDLETAVAERVVEKFGESIGQPK